MTNQEIIDYIKRDYPTQKDVYLWSTFILPDGTFVLPENDNDDYLNDMYEHANIIGGVADNCFDGKWFQAEQWLEQNCVKGNANYPYLHFPENPTNKQYWAAEDYMNGVQGGFDLNFDIFDAMDGVQDMGCPFYVSLYGKDGRAYDLDIYKSSEIIDRIKKAKVSGVLEESVENNMIKIKFTDYAEPYMRGAIYEMESDFAPHERDWNNDGEVYTDLLAVFKLVDREGNIDRFGPKPPNKLPLTKGAYDDLLRSGQIQVIGSEVQQKDYKKMAIDYLNNLTMESLLKENTLEDFGPYSISAGYTKTIKWGTVGLFDVEYKDRTVYISDWIESEEELKYKVDKAITKINTLKESLERVMKFTVVAYNKDADTYVDLFTTEDVHEAIVEAEKNAYLCLRDRLRDKDGEPFDWIEVVDERDKVYWASYDDFVPEVGAILTRERFDALVSNGDKTGHLATPSHNFIYYPDRGIVVTDRANPKKSTTIHIDDVKKGYEHIRDVDADKVLTESFRKGLNEGPGSGDRRTTAQRYNDRADKIFQGKKNLDRAQAEYLRRLGLSEEEITQLTNDDKLQLKLIELGEKDNFFNKYDFKSGLLKESYNENSPKVKLTMNNFDSYEGGDTASYTVDNVDTIKPYIIDIGYKTTYKFSDDLYQIKQDNIKKVEVVAMTQNDIYRTDVDVQVYIDIDDNMDLIYCGTYTDSNDVKDVAMVEKIVNDWMRTGKTVKTIKEDFMMEDTMKKDYNKLFSEFLDLIEFQLVENVDDSYTDANGDAHEGKWSLIDLQGGNIGGIEARRYTNAADMIEDLDIYIDDYIFNSIIDSLKDIGIQSSYSDYRILRYRDKLPDNEWDFDVLDMIANHADEIDLEKVDHNGFLPVGESLRESSRIGKTMSIDEIAELCGGYEQVQDIVDDTKENYPGIDCDELAEMTYHLCDSDEVSEEEWSSLIEYVCSGLEESLKENVNGQSSGQINNFTSWNDAYDVFISIADKYLPDEHRVQAEVEKFYLENKSNPFVKEAYRRWMDEDHIDSNLEESIGNVVDTVYDVNTLDYEDDKLYKRNIEHYDTYTDYDEALETYKELSHESFYPHVELCQVDVYEDGHRDYKVLKSTYGNELVEDFDQEQDTAWTKDEICAEIKSLTSNFTVKNGEAKTFFDEEKDFAVACLEENGYTVTADKQGGKWVIVYKKQVKEHVAVDRYDQLNKDNAKGVIQINATPSGKVLKENAEDYKATLLADTKKAIERDKKLLDVARREAANDPKHKAYYDKMVADLESHIAYNEERIEKLSKEETKVDFADSMNSRTFDSAMASRDSENRKALENADKVKPSIVRKGQPGYDNLEYAAMIATEKSPRGFTYTLGDTYLDFGSGWQWTTLIADKNNGRDSYQALNQVEWEEIANADSNEVIDRVIDNMFKDQYCPDRISRRVESVEDALLRLDMMD